MQRLSGWLFSDEKWWDIVGTTVSVWVKDDSKIESKIQNQVCVLMFMFVCVRVCFYIR